MDSIRRAALADAAAFRDAASVAIVEGKKDCSVRDSSAGAGGGASNADQPFGAGLKRRRMSDIRPGWMGVVGRSLLREGRTMISVRVFVIFAQARNEPRTLGLHKKEPSERPTTPRKRFAGRAWS